MEIPEAGSKEVKEVNKDAWAVKLAGSYGKSGLDVWVLKLGAAGHCSEDGCPD